MCGLAIARHTDSRFAGTVSITFQLKFTDFIDTVI